MGRRWRGLVVVAIALAGALRSAPREIAGAPRYVGSETCGSCHRSEYVRWQGSHHARAMQPARDDTVLGDFGGATFDVRGRRWRFCRDGGRFVVTAEGPDGALHEYPVAYTFGVAPLQQYLVPFAGGRLQALSVAWDTTRRRWFSLRETAPTDWLHWSRGGQRWNTMCADCHSTNVAKGYDDTTDTFHTTFSEVAVGCEACHGPGSQHVADPTRTAPRAPAGGHEQVERCAPCHARRAQLADGGTPGTPLLDRYLPATLDQDVFHADGQILDEDFEYQSFTQSKMYARGVACGDCHDVHTGTLRATGNALCTRCHAKAFDAPAHHGHAPGARCVSCHMPSQTYMVVHARRDHSLRVPRPDLAATTAAPSACAAAGCHADRGEAWIASAYQRMFGARARASQPHWGTVIAAGRAPTAEAAPALAALAGDRGAPAIARATALTLLGPRADGTAALDLALADPDPLLRATAAASYPAVEPAELVGALAPLLADPVRAVRLAAVARLAEVPPELRVSIPRFDAVLAEYIASQRYMSDLPSGPFNLGNLYESLGRPGDAERAYRRAIAIDDRLVAAKVNLALLLAQEHRGGEAEALLRSVRPGDAGFATAAYNLALLIMDRDPAEAIALLRRAIADDPSEPRYAQLLELAVREAGESGR